MMMIFDPLSAGFMIILGFCRSWVRALRSAPDRLSGTSVGGRYLCRARLSVVMRFLVVGCNVVQSGSQLEGFVKGVW